MRTKILVSTLLKTTSDINILRYSKDKSKRNRSIAMIVGKSIVYTILLIYMLFMTIGYCIMGMSEIVPTITAMTLCLMEFLLSLFKVNGYLFGCKDNDLIMSMPFTQKEVMSARFLEIYFKDLAGILVISMANLIGYTIMVRPPVYSVIMWIVLTFFVPVIPLIGATIIGTAIAAFTARFKLKKILNAVLSFAVILLCFGSRFIIEDSMKEGNIEETLLQAVDGIKHSAGLFPPLGWFTNGVLEAGVSDIMLLIGVSILIYEIVFFIISKNYAKINSKINTIDAVKGYDNTRLKRRGVVVSVAYKELRHLLDSTNYLVNAAIGVVLIVILTALSLVLGMDNIIAVVTNNAPVSREMLLPAVPLIIYFLAGMVSTCAISPSLEGKTVWIVDSLPVRKMDYYKGKMLFNILMFGPVSVIGTVCVGMACGANIIEQIVFIITISVLILFSTCYGLVCGIKFIRLDWEKDIEAIKQGAAVAVYMLPNMFVVMGLTVAAIIIGLKTGAVIVNAGVIGIGLILTAICYRVICKYAKR